MAQSGPGVAKPTPIEQFLGSHPAALRFVTTPRPAPDSFGTLAFYGVNAFKFTNAKGVSTTCATRSCRWPGASMH